jgi:protein TonB
MRTWTLLVSIGAHAAALGAMIVAPIFATSALPEPRRATTFVSITPVEPPPAPVVVRQSRTLSSAEALVPLAEPIRVHAETPVDVSTHLVTDLSGPVGDGMPPGDVIAGGEPTPPPSPSRRAPLPVGGVIQPPKRVTYVAPEYPRMALAARLEGVVILQAVIDESGAVSEVRVLRSRPHFDSAAMEAVSQWRFTPTLLNGRPVPVVMTVTVGFTLTN